MSKSPNPAAARSPAAAAPQQDGVSEKSPLLQQSARVPSPSQASAREAQSQTVSARIWAVLGGKSGAITALYCLLLLISAVGNSIFFKKMTNALPNYPYFLSQLTTVVYLPFFFGLVAYELMFTNYITPEMRAFPKSKFFAMGLFDAVSGVLMLFGGVHTAGSTQALLMNAVIPITMLLSVVFLKTKFKAAQYAGAATIMAGVGVVLLPQFLPSDEAVKPTDDNSLFFNLLFLAAVIPGALSSVYKEIAFQDQDIDVNWLQAWVALWQTFFGVCLIPVNTLSFLGDNALPVSQLGSALLDGARCLGGENTIVLPACTTTHEPGLKPCDACEGSWIPIVVYLIFNVNFNIFVVLVIKHGGAALMYIIMTLRLPLVQLAFSLSFINNPPDHLKWSTALGLAVILVGLVAYRWSSISKRPPSEDVEDVVVAAFGQVEISAPIRRRVPIHLRRDAVQIRSGFYSRIGVINSPITPHSPRARSPAPSRGHTPHGTPGRKNLTSSSRERQAAAGQSNFLSASSSQSPLSASSTGSSGGNANSSRTAQVTPRQQSVQRDRGGERSGERDNRDFGNNNSSGSSRGGASSSKDHVVDVR